MNKLKYLLYGFAGLAMVSCGDDALDTESYTMSTTGNFPKTASDVTTMLTAAYAPLNAATASPVGTYIYVAMAASDEAYGGGGENDIQSQAADHLMVADYVTYDNFWKVRYQGISRANTVIEAMQEGAVGYEAFKNDPDQLGQYKGEALFLRGLYYFELAQLFERVPLMMSTLDDIACGQAEPDQIYAAIASSLKEASEIMPSKAYNSVEAGHATRWASQALLARVFLFYTGFYGKETLPLMDGSSLNKAQVAAYLDDCIQNSGHDLVGDFRNLWPYTNKSTIKDYPYVAEAVDADGNGLSWAGNDNVEQLFSIKYCNYAGWEYTNQMGYCNQYQLYWGVRNSSAKNGSEGTFPIGAGWGQCPTTSIAWDDWKAYDPADMRREATICSLTEEEGMDYKFGEDKQMEETGYWNKKYAPISTKEYLKDDGSINFPNTFWCVDETYDVSKNGNDMQGAHYTNMCLIRFADVLLMHSELTGTADGMNRVRTRAGLPAVGYSVEQLRQERRFELMFEGVRWGDMRRYGDQYCIDALNHQNGKTIFNKGQQVTMSDGKYESRYKATRGFFPIPQAEISLSLSNSEGNQYVQNKGWDGADAKFSSWNF